MLYSSLRGRKYEIGALDIVMKNNFTIYSLLPLYFSEDTSQYYQEGESNKRHKHFKGEGKLHYFWAI